MCPRSLVPTALESGPQGELSSGTVPQGGMDVSDAQKLLGLEVENAKLKWLSAEAMIQAGLKDLLAKMVTPAKRREVFAHLIAARQMGERRACRLAGVELTLVRYRSRRPDDVELLTCLRGERRRFGHRNRRAAVSGLLPQGAVSLGLRQRPMSAISGGRVKTRAF